MKINFFPLGLCFFLLLTACGRSAPTNYFLLESSAPPLKIDKLPAKTLRVAQVETAAYLGRNNIVSRVNQQSRLIVGEFHLWAEPVGAGVRRVIEETLLEPLYKNGVALLPSSTENRGDFTLLIDVQRLDGNFDEKAVLESWWTLIDRDERTIERGMYAAEEMVNGSDYNMLVGAESKLLQNFGLYLAEKLPLLMQGAIRKR